MFQNLGACSILKLIPAFAQRVLRKSCCGVTMLRTKTPSRAHASSQECAIQAHSVDFHPLPCGMARIAFDLFRRSLPLD